MVLEDAGALVEDGEGNVEEVPHPDLHVLEDGTGWGARRLPPPTLLGFRLGTVGRVWI